MQTSVKNAEAETSMPPLVEAWILNGEVHQYQRRRDDRKSNQDDQGSLLLPAESLSFPVISEVRAEPSMVDQPIIKLFRALEITGRGKQEERSGWKKGNKNPDKSDADKDAAENDQRPAINDVLAGRFGGASGRFHRILKSLIEAILLASKRGCKWRRF